MNCFAFSKILLRYFKFLVHLEFLYFFNTWCIFWPISVFFQDLENWFWNLILFQYRVGTLVLCTCQTPDLVKARRPQPVYRALLDNPFLGKPIFVIQTFALFESDMFKTQDLMVYGWPFNRGSCITLIQTCVAICSIVDQTRRHKQ